MDTSRAASASGGSAANRRNSSPPTVRGACSPPFTTRAATKHGWRCCAKKTTPARAALTEAFHLTTREAEALYWVICGKTNRDIGDILGASPRTVHKHLEHVFEKLGVETRTAAASMAMAMARLRDAG